MAHHLAVTGRLTPNLGEHGNPVVMRTLLSGWITRLTRWMRKLPSDLSPACIETIEARMRPGVSSREGFLDAHERLLDVIERDEAVCRERGISPHQIADRLESIAGKAYRLADLATRGRISLPEDAARGLTDGEGAGITVDDQFRVTGQKWHGVQDCPFEDERGKPCQGSTYASADLRIENLRHRERLTPPRSDASSPGAVIEFPGLIIHLIRDHHFFEGSVPYRLAPERAVDVLEIESGKDYAPKYATEATWRLREGTASPYDSLKPWYRAHFGRCMERPDHVVDLADGIRLYVKGDTCSVIADRELQLEQPLVILGAEWTTRVISPGTWVYGRFEEDHVVL